LGQGWKKCENRRKKREKIVRRKRYNGKRPATVREGNKS